MKVFGGFFVTGAVLAGMLLFSAPASATTFCVPNYFADCPNSGGNVATANLATAFSQNGSDGNPDTVYIDEFTYTDPGSIDMSGTDDMTVIGSGRDKSIITSSSSQNIYVLRTNNRTGQVKMRDLAILVPASFPDVGGPGSALQARLLDLDRVDFITENDDSSAISNMIGGGTYNDVHIFGRNGASFDRGIDGDTCSAGTLMINQADIQVAGTAITSRCKDRPVVVDRSDLSGAGAILSVSNGASLDVSNTLVRAGDFSPILGYNGTADQTSLKLDHVTAIALGDNSISPLLVQMGNTVASTGNINIEVRNSILAGFAKSWDLQAPVNPARGDIALTLAYSNFVPSGQAIGDVTVNQATGNLNVNPGFVDITDFHLSLESPMVDAGDPNAQFPDVDFENNARPIDGDYDDVAIRDMGAYELNPPPPSCPQDPSLCPNPIDKTAPKLSKLKFRFRVGKGGAIRYRVSEASKISIVLRPVPVGKGKKKRKVVRIKRGNRKGPGVITLGKKKLKRGKYRLVIRATDKAGNTSKPIVRKVKTKG